MIRFTELQANSYSHNRSNPISGSVRFGCDTVEFSFKKWSKFMLSHDNIFNDEVVGSVVSELVGLYKDKRVQLIDFFFVSYNIDPIRISYWCISEVIKKLCM